MFTVGMIIQARMTSTRLPGKILKKVKGKPLLAYQIERLRDVTSAQKLIVATTTNDKDDPVVALCESMDVPCVRGSEHDVLSRYYQAAQLFDLNVVTRVTSDCPLIDPEVVDGVIQMFLKYHKQYAFVSNCLKRTFPRGLDCEVFSFETLKNAYENATTDYQKEHVTPYIFETITSDQQGHYTLENENFSDDRWTVDHPEDFELIKHIIEDLYPQNIKFRFRDVLRLLDDHPEYRKLNEHVKQKGT